MKRVIKISGISIIILIFASGCNLFDSVSPAERLTQFESNLNTESRTSSYSHIHSDAQIYEDIKDSNWWDGVLSTSNNPFTFNVTMGVEVSGIVTGTGTITYNSNTYDVIITFKELVSGDDTWYIYSLNINSTNIIY